MQDSRLPEGWDRNKIEECLTLRRQQEAKTTWINTLNAIERAMDRRTARGANDESLIQWLTYLKQIHLYPCQQRDLDGFIDAIKQTPLKQNEEVK